MAVEKAAGFNCSMKGQGPSLTKNGQNRKFGIPSVDGGHDMYLKRVVISCALAL